MSEAYLNAALIMLAMGVPASKGFPEPSPSGRRDACNLRWTHILSLVTEVATRCLKAVRRQKFNYHRRARPEAIGGRPTLSYLGRRDDKFGDKLGLYRQGLRCDAGGIARRPAQGGGTNTTPSQAAMVAMRGFECETSSCTPHGVDPDLLADCNLLLLMAFPEGSPMHPSYGAGHATVAGGCDRPGRPSSKCSKTVTVMSKGH